MEKIVDHSNQMVISLFTATDEGTSDVIDTQIILIDSSIVKEDSQQIHSKDLKIAFEKFIAKNMNLDYPEMCCRRYEIYNMNKLIPKEIIDSGYIKDILIPYLRNNNIQAVETESKELYLMELKLKQVQTKKDLCSYITGENAVELIKKYQEDRFKVEDIVDRLLANPYEQFTDSENIIKALKKTRYYLNSKIKDTSDIRSIAKIGRLHILLAKLRNRSRECQILFDLYRLQNLEANFANMILTYAQDELVTEKQIQILTGMSFENFDPEINPRPIINAIKQTAYYRNQIRQDQIIDDPKPYHLLLAILKTYTGLKDRCCVSFGSRVTLSQYEDGIQDYIKIKLELLKRNILNYPRCWIKEDLKEVNYWIKQRCGLKEFKKDIDFITENLRLKIQPEIEIPRPSFFSVRIENCEDILGELDALFTKYNQPYGREFGDNVIGGNIDTLPNRQNIENVFLELHRHTDIHFPLFKTTLYYNFSVKTIIKSFIDDYLTGMGYKSQPFISFFDDQNGELNIVTLNIRANALYSPICAVMNHPRAMKVISELEIKYNLSQHIVDKSIIDNIDKLLGDDTSARLKGKNPGLSLKK